MKNNKTKKFKGLKIFASVCVLTAAVAGISAVADIKGFGDGNNADFSVPKGAGLSAIAEDLKDSGIIRFSSVFKIYTKLSGEHIWQTGVHKLNTGMSYKEIIAVLQDTPKAVNGTVTVPEGYELRQIADLLTEQGLVNREVFMREAETGNFDNEFLKDIPNRENRLEGYLFPDTYNFIPGESEHEIIGRMLDNFEEKLIPLYTEANTDKSLDDVVKLASVIEREAANDAERGKVASVFVNRLNGGMKLESCATVQYILKERKKILSTEDTQIDSPYNTYKYDGLPVGPIASFGMASFKAALYPEDTNYMYFMAVADGSSSVFAETYEQHLENMKNIQGE